MGGVSVGEAADVLQFIKGLDVSKQALTESDLVTILETLVADGKIVQIAATSGGPAQFKVSLSHGWLWRQGSVPFVPVCHRRLVSSTFSTYEVHRRSLGN